VYVTIAHDELTGSKADLVIVSTRLP